jgi:hypothetical protein
MWYLLKKEEFHCNNNQYGQVELDLRLDQAARIISGLRDLIAEKSFQFSDVIRVAPRKGVRTRARSTIAKLNNHIAYHCRVYNHCRAALVKLGANDATLTKYRTLQRNDIGSSTALLNPNEPGSTTSHRLSWIWQSSRTTEDETSVGLYECKLYNNLLYYYSLTKQSIVCTGYVRGLKCTDGMKSSFLSAMKWTGL